MFNKKKNEVQWIFIVLTEVQSNMIIVMWCQFSHIPSMTAPYSLYIDLKLIWPMKWMGRYLNVKGLWVHSVQLSLSYVLSLRHTRYFIKSPQYTGGDYVFVPVRTPPPLPPPPPAADSCSRDNFWTTFWISFIFSTIVGPDLQITWLDFGRFSSWPWPRFFKVKYGICYISAKNGPIATKRKANISIEL